MDIKVNAHGRYVEVIGIEVDDPEEAVDLVYALWEATDSDKPRTGNDLSAGNGVYLDRKSARIGFSYLGDGERPEVR